MGTKAETLLYWAPRMLCILYAAFISIFALDAFESGAPWFQVAVALMMHLIPTFLVLLILAVSWRREWVGAVSFTLLAVLYLLWSWGKFNWMAPAFIAGPLVLTGALFAANWRLRRERRRQVLPAL